MYDGDMVMTKKALEEMNNVVYGALTKFYQKVIAPKMATKDDLADIRNEMATKGDLAAVEERLTERIDKLGEIITDTRTNHERRIRKLEDEVGIEPGARLTY